MKHILSFFLIIFCIVSSLPANGIGADANDAGIIYCSSFDGDDANDGLTEQTPRRTIPSLSEGKTIKMKCGSIYYRSFSLSGGTVLTHYGAGPQPIICGFKAVAANAGAWERGSFDPQTFQWKPDRQGIIWRLDLNDPSLTGYAGTDYATNNIGAIYEPDKDQLHGLKAHYRTEAEYRKALSEDRVTRQTDPQQCTWLTKDFDFWQDGLYNDEGQKPSNELLQYLYVYYADDLNALNLCFSVGRTGVSGTDFTLDGIDVIGWGCHGCAGLQSNVTIRNCHIDIIGGMRQIGYPIWVRLGNGIEFYLSGSTYANNIIEHNVISRTFDCGATIQGGDQKGKEQVIKDIVFRHNVFRNCRQAYEFFLRPNMLPDGLNHVRNCAFTDNLIFSSGYNEFEPWEQRNTDLLAYTIPDLDNEMYIQDNTFVGGMGIWCCQHPNGYCKTSTRNTFIITPGTTLWASGYGGLTFKIPDEGDCIRSGSKRGKYPYICSFEGTTSATGLLQVTTLKERYAATLQEAQEGAIRTFNALTGWKATRIILVDDITPYLTQSYLIRK